MCLAAVALHQHPRWRLVLAANRDEFFARPASPLAFQSEGWLGGRDLQAGGSWLALHPLQARLALVTNVREPGVPAPPGAVSRGALVTEALLDDRRWHEGPDDRPRQGFNLLQLDLRAASGRWFSNRGGPALLAAAVHGLSNAQLDTPWPKLLRLKAKLQLALRGEDLEAALFDALADDQAAQDEALPATGVPLAWERALSSAFIRMSGYGTRCSTLVLASADTVRVIERRYGEGGAAAGQTELSFALSG
ncbi:MAG: NRDE family protein [Burkholderiales bacterium]|nr:NRDE family protein [Burkholderiales bacterium]